MTSLIYLDIDKAKNRTEYTYFEHQYRFDSVTLRCLDQSDFAQESFSLQVLNVDSSKH